MRTREHNLPEHLAFFHVLVGGAGVFQRKGAVDHWSQASSKNVSQDFVQLAHGTHIGAENRELSRIDEAQLDSDVRAGRRAASHERSGRLERFQAFFPGRGADVFDNNVHAFLVCDLLNFSGNCLLVMIDSVIRTEGAGFLQFLFVSGGGDYAGLKELRNLNGGDAHTRTGPKHENGLPDTNASPADQHVPGSQKNQGNAGGFVEIQVRGKWNYVHSGNGNQFAVAAINAIA